METRNFDQDGVAILLRSGNLLVRGVYSGGVSLVVTKRGVRAWAARWPCFGTYRALSFSFDSKCGDIIDHNARADMDSAGVSALAYDALRAALIRRKLVAGISE